MKFRIFSIWFTTLMGLDFVTTEIAMMNGLLEGNFLMKTIVTIPALFLALKILITSIIIWLYAQSDSSNPIVQFGMKLLLIIMMIVVSWNVYQIITNQPVQVII